jgi:predicted O-methyltransferase YrrM
MTGTGTTPGLDEDPPRQPTSERLQVLAFGAIGWPWLLKSLYGGTKRGKRALLKGLGLPPDALPNLGSWKADVGFLQVIADHIRERKPKSVVELGAGVTSLVAARALQLNGEGKLLSFEHHADFATRTRRWLFENDVKAEVRHAPLRPSPGGWPGLWYDHGPLPERIDLLIIDGPPWSVHPYVRGAAETMFERIPPGGVILLDDAARPGERIVARRWRKNWPDFEFKFARLGSKGTLIGTRMR